MQSAETFWKSTQKCPKWCFWVVLVVLGGVRHSFFQICVLQNIFFGQLSVFGPARPCSGPAGVQPQPPPGGGRLASDNEGVGEPVTALMALHEHHGPWGVGRGQSVGAEHEALQPGHQHHATLDVRLDEQLRIPCGKGPEARFLSPSIFKATLQFLCTLPGLMSDGLMMG